LQALLDYSLIPHLRAIRLNNSFSITIGEVNIMAVIPEAVDLASLVFEKIFHGICAVVISLTLVKRLFGKTANKKANWKDG
jgi:hypothetical protein